MSGLCRWVIVVVAAVTVVVIDQLTKWWAVDRLRDRAPLDVIWTLRFNYAENTGMAFSKGTGAGRFIAVVVVGIVVALVLLARRVTSRWGLVLIGVVIGGAFGNLIDRVFRAETGFLTGGVVDWIDVQWWPIFNVADACVVVGGILIALFLLREPADDEALDPADSSHAPEAPDAADAGGSPPEPPTAGTA